MLLELSKKPFVLSWLRPSLGHQSRPKIKSKNGGPYLQTQQTFLETQYIPGTQQTFFQTQHGINQTQQRFNLWKHNTIISKHNTIFAKHNTKFSLLHNAGFVAKQSLNPYLLNRWHVMRLPRMCQSVARMDVFFLSAWTDEKSSKETDQYYSRCGEAVNKEKVLIRDYFQRGFDYSVILLFLEQYHATACLCVLWTIGLASTRIRRRNTNSNVGEIYQAIQQEFCVVFCKYCAVCFNNPCCVSINVCCV